MNERGFTILYESRRCLAVSKPPGLLTQSPPGVDSLEVRIKQFLIERDAPESVAGSIYLGVPHRIDRPASGAMVFGKTRRATRRLAEQFERREVGKMYWAYMEGEAFPPAGSWRDFVQKIPDQAQARVVEPSEADAKEAVLHYRTLGTVEWGSWLQIELETGRTHQVRVQAASRGHPVVGDAQYGSSLPFGPQHSDERLRAIALHCRELTFFDSSARREVQVVAPAPPFWGESAVCCEDTMPPPSEEPNAEERPNEEPPA